MKDLKLLEYHFFIPDFNLLSFELDNFLFKMLYSVILYYIYYIKAK